MFGWINDCCESLVVTKYGISKWHEIKTEAGCEVPDVGFIRHQYYSDESSVDLVVATSRVLGLSVDHVLEAFGQYFLEFTRHAGYGSMLSCQGSNLKAWLSNLNALHDHLQDTLPRGRFPQFWCEDMEDGSILLHYHSDRGSLFVPFVVGLVKEVSHFHFHLSVKLDRLQTQGEQENVLYTTWKISTTDSSLMHKLTADQGWVQGDMNDIEDTRRQMEMNDDVQDSQRCPFHSQSSKTIPISESTGNKFWERANPKKLHTYEQEDTDSNTTTTLPLHLSSSTSTTEPPLPEPNFMSNQIMKNIFPFHLILNDKFTILQHGKDLPRLISNNNERLLQKSAKDIFQIKRPSLGSWDWSVLNRLRDQTFYLQSGEGVHLKAHFIPLSQEPKHVFVSLAPDAKNVKQLQDMKLNMNDLPVHSFQRDVIFLGEHLLSGIRSTHKLDKLSRKLVNEHNLSNTLLYSMLPREVAKILRSGKPFEPSYHDNVTLFFSDVVGFTDMCSELFPWDIIDMLNRLYTVMDLLVEKFKLYKVETIGDAYMCCSGLLEPNTYHAEDVANFAIAARRCVSLVKSPLTQEPIRMRIGIHSGSCMSGVVGTLTPRYCLFGDMVNTTSRHESTGEPEKIHCSSVTYNILSCSTESNSHYHFTSRGLVDMKGKGELQTYWLDDADETNPYVNSVALKSIEKEVQEMLESRSWRKRSYFPRTNSDLSTVASMMDSVNINEDLSQDDFDDGDHIIKGTNDDLNTYLDAEDLFEKLKAGKLGRSFKKFDMTDDLLEHILQRSSHESDGTNPTSSESDHHIAKSTVVDFHMSTTSGPSTNHPTKKKQITYSHHHNDTYEKHNQTGENKMPQHSKDAISSKKKDMEPPMIRLPSSTQSVGSKKSVFQRLYEQAERKTLPIPTKSSGSLTSIRPSTRSNEKGNVRRIVTPNHGATILLHESRWR